jgi:hypothetical protein
MAKIRITGLVKMANDLRAALASPRSAAEMEAIRRRAAATIRQVDALLASIPAHPGDLPTPSRNAYRFLADLHRGEPPLPPTAGTPRSPAAGSGERLRVSGLRSQLEGILICLEAPWVDRKAIAAAVSAHSTALEQALARAQARPEQLSEETRGIRGWLAYFAEGDNLDAYLAATAQARRAFDAALGGTRFRAPARIRLRPLRGLYRLRGDRDGTAVALPTPMVTFDAALLEHLAGHAAGRHRDRRPVVEAMTAQPYQAVQAELESLGGVVERAAGACHDLARSFARVNEAYFGGRMDRPRLAWSATFSQRKLGHYDPVRDTVMLSSRLDRQDVPEYVVDFIVYHELLHKHHGIAWHGPRAHVHTPAFKRDERRFVRHAQAETFLARLGAEA